MLKDIVIALLIITVSIAGFAAWLSPYWSLAGLLQAAAAHDEVAIEQYLDMPTLRASASTHPQLAGDIAGMDIMLLDDEVETRLLRRANKRSNAALTTQTFFGFADPAMAGRSRVKLTFSALKTMHANWVSDSVVQIANPEIAVLNLRRERLEWKLVDVSDPRTGALSP